MKAEDFRKRTELAVGLIRRFVPPVERRVVVLVGSTYCGAAVIESAVERGFVVIGWVRKDRLLTEGRLAAEVTEETIASLQGMNRVVKLVHRGQGKGRGTAIGTDPKLSRQAILRHLKHRWGIEVMFRLTKEQFGLGECRGRGEASLERWVELVCLAYVLGRTHPLGQTIDQARGELDRDPSGMGRELDGADLGGDRVVRYPGPLTAEDCSLPSLFSSPEAATGDCFAAVKNLCWCLMHNLVIQVHLQFILDEIRSYGLG